MAYIIGLTAHSFWMITLSNALIISGVSLNYSLLIVFVSESFPARTRNKASIYVFLFEVGGYIAFTILEIFQVDYIHIYWLGLIPTLFILAFSFKIRETLFYQQERLNVKDMFENALSLDILNKSDKVVEIKKKFLINIDHKLFLRGIKSFRM